MSKRFMAILLAAVMSLQVVACDTKESDVTETDLNDYMITP